MGLSLNSIMLMMKTIVPFPQAAKADVYILTVLCVCVFLVLISALGKKQLD